MREWVRGGWEEGWAMAARATGEAAAAEAQVEGACSIRQTQLTHCRGEWFTRECTPSQPSHATRLGGAGLGGCGGAGCPPMVTFTALAPGYAALNQVAFARPWANCCASAPSAAPYATAVCTYTPWVDSLRRRLLAKAVTPPTVTGGLEPAAWCVSGVEARCHSSTQPDKQGTQLCKAPAYTTPTTLTRLQCSATPRQRRPSG